MPKRTLPSPDESGPEHYTEGMEEHQHWNVMQEWLGEDGWQGYMVGSITKYLSRWQFKGGVDDLRKAQHYLAKLIAELEAAASGIPPRA